MKKKLIIAASVILIVGLTVGLTIYGIMPIKETTFYVTIEKLREKTKDRYYIPERFPFEGEMTCEYSYSTGLRPSNFTLNKEVVSYMIDIVGDGKRLKIAPVAMGSDNMVSAVYRETEVVYYTIPEQRIACIGLDSPQSSGVVFWEQWDNDQAEATVKSDLKMLVDQTIDYFETLR